MTTATEQALQRRKDDLLSAAVSAERQLTNVARAIAALDPDTLRAAGLPPVDIHFLRDSSTAVSTAARARRSVQYSAEKLGAVR